MQVYLLIDLIINLIIYNNYFKMWVFKTWTWIHIPIFINNKNRSYNGVIPYTAMKKIN